MRKLRLPPPDFDRIKIPIAAQPASKWLRAHQASRSPIYFSVNRNHRFSHQGSVYPLLYCGGEIATCLFERFGDEIYDGKRSLSAALWLAHGISEIEVPPLRICDLTNGRTLSALMVDLTALTNEELEIPQQWGLAIQRHPAKFQGIKYKSRFNAKNCLVIFGRDGIQEQVRQTFSGSLGTLETSLDWIEEHQVSLY